MRSTSLVHAAIAAARAFRRRVARGGLGAARRDGHLPRRQKIIKLSRKSMV